MTGFPAYASPETPGRHGDRVLVCSTNWLGDTIMALPAVQAYRATNPEHHLVVITKPPLQPLWAMHTAPDEVLVMGKGGHGLQKAVRDLRALKFSKAYIFPNSFRAALVPWLARIPSRIGRPRFPRSALLTRHVSMADAVSRNHQYAEYFELFGLPVPTREQAVPALRTNAQAVTGAERLLADLPTPRVALIPGAARGPSKQWPEDRFLALGRRLINETAAGVVLLGTPREEALCARLANSLGSRARTLAGMTSLPEFAAILSACRLVVANDSGGMHLATAMGTPVIALFGITDPDKTGPLGPHAEILQHSTVKRRAVPRESDIARKALEAISTDEVFSRASVFLDAQPEAPTP